MRLSFKVSSFFESGKGIPENSGIKNEKSNELQVGESFQTIILRLIFKMVL